MIRQALILASGKGSRMKPLTEKIPKPLVKINKISMLDRVIRHVEESGIEKIVINTYHLSEIMENHIRSLNNPKIKISLEDRFMENGGSVINALKYLDDEPFITINSDVVWFEDQEEKESNLQRLINEFNPDEEDILMLLKDKEEFFGYSGKGDFDINNESLQLLRPHEYCDYLPYCYIGIQAINPDIFKKNTIPEIPFKFNRFYFNEKTWQKNNLLNRVKGLKHRGKIFHVGTVKDIEATEELIRKLSLE